MKTTYQKIQTGGGVHSMLCSWLCYILCAGLKMHVPIPPPKVWLYLSLAKTLLRFFAMNSLTGDVVEKMGIPAKHL
jgi:hypothetical protein